MSTDEKTTLHPMITETQFLAMRKAVRVIRGNLHGMIEETRIELPSGHMMYTAGSFYILKCISRYGDSIIIKMFREVGNVPFSFTFTAGGDLDSAIGMLGEARDLLVKDHGYIVPPPAPEKKKKKRNKGRKNLTNETSTSSEKESTEKESSSQDSPSEKKILKAMKYPRWEGKLLVRGCNLVIYRRPDTFDPFKAIGVELPDGKVRALNDRDIEIASLFGFSKDQETFDKEKGEDGFIHIPGGSMGTKKD